MKNKAQKALNDLYDKATTEYEFDEDDGELIQLDCTNDDKYLDMREPIQNLIDNQLTVEELRTLIHVYKRYCVERKVPFIEDSSIFGKLKNQKEMWEVEQCRN